tara:strand:- start:15 stop:362 length:348 start_codon:yes stop_codon:yes gene_type:complete
MNILLLNKMDVLLGLNQFVVSDSTRNGVADNVTYNKGLFNFVSGFALYTYHTPEKKSFIGGKVTEEAKDGFYVTYQRSGYETTAHDNYIDMKDIEKFMHTMMAQSKSLEFSEVEV